MHLKFLSSIAVLVLTIVFAACNAIDTKINTQAQKANANAAPAHPDGVRRITVAELEALIKEGKAFIVDVRTQETYDLGHIPGAKLIPTSDIANHLKEMPRDKTIVTYCS